MCGLTEITWHHRRNSVTFHSTLCVPHNRICVWGQWNRPFFWPFRLKKTKKVERKARIRSFYLLPGPYTTFIDQSREEPSKDGEIYKESQQEYYYKYKFRRDRPGIVDPNGGVELFHSFCLHPRWPEKCCVPGKGKNVDFYPLNVLRRFGADFCLRSLRLHFLLLGTISLCYRCG